CLRTPHPRDSRVCSFSLHPLAFPCSASYRNGMTLTPPEADAADTLIRLALAEDLSTTGDRTSLATIPATATARPAFVARSVGVVAGLPVAERVCRAVSTDLIFTPTVADGTATTRGMTLATVSGPLRAILEAERTALNFLQRLSGVA